MSQENPPSGAAPQASDAATKKRNDAARILLRYLNYVALFHTDKGFGGSAKGPAPQQLQEMIKFCRAAAFKLGLIGFLPNSIELTPKGRRFVPGAPVAKPKDAKAKEPQPTTPAPVNNG